ncbi:MAG: lytic transglycosylase domain-containing protein, partial [Desulfovibrionaceae bacterium]|nr:lytic transglycosylase domain-containing protein [Desulfovibrionaceae bacterium]
MLPGLEMMVGCPNLAIPAEVMRHVVSVESGANPFAIGVVGGRLVRQPQNLDEAVATANMLEAQGYNYSLGLAQINRVNFSKYGFDTPAKAFDICANLSAGANILANCYRDAGGDWGKAFSCYYSGNFVTGFLQGYVRKIYNSILSAAQTEAGPSRTEAIPIVFGSNAAAAPAGNSNPPALLRKQAAATVMPPAVLPRGAQVTSAAQRIAMRSAPTAVDPANVDARPALPPMPAAAVMPPAAIQPAAA